MAQYVIGNSRDEVMLLPARVDDYVAPESPLRALDAFVDSLDLAKLGFPTRHEDSSGRSSYDPAIMVKLYLWGYLKRSRSSRNLEEACATNLGVIWLAGNLQPDHSTISDFRKTNGKALKKIFKEFNLLCLELDLFSRELIAIDGTFIKGVNSKDKSFTKTKLNKLIEGIDKAIERYLERLETTDEADVQAESKQLERVELEEKIQRIKDRRAEYEGYLVQCETSPTGQVNLTDPESVQLAKGDKRTVGYNVQTAVDAKHHLVASVEVTQDGNDMHQLNAMAQQAKEDLGLEPEAKIKAVADKGYPTGAELAACESNNTEVYAEPQKTKSETNGLYNEEDFSYDAESDSYQCPAGETLKRAADRTCSGATIRVYQNTGACKECPLKEKCTKGQFRRVHVNEHKEEIEAARKRLAEAPEMRQARGAIVEHPFGTVKDRNGRHDLLCIGKEMAGVEMSLSFWAYNFTRASNILGIGKLIEAIRTRKQGETA